jgi:SAM-dependent methyltransferase
MPQLEGLSQRLSSPSSAFLDVGSGVGGICITLARMWPNLRVVGLEPAEPPLAEARRNISASGLGDRIEIRRITLEELTDVDAFDAGWLPQVFLPLDVLQRSLGPFHRSIKPGGWAILFTLSSPGAELRPSLARFRNVLWGGEPLSPENIAELLAHAGFSELRVEPAGGIPGANVVLGRKAE